MHILLHKDIEDVFAHRSFQNSLNGVLLVCPDPITADGLWNKASQNLEKCSTVTISHLISELIRLISPEIEVSNKEELLLIFAAISKSIGVKNFEHYLKIYNLFSELRSFTLDVSLVKDVLEEYEELTRTGVAYLWNIMGEMELVDEHGACKAISKEILSKKKTDFSETFLNKKIIFSSFKFMNAIQIDFIKSLSGIAEVYIAFPENVYKSSKDSDWIKWLVTDDNCIEYLSGEVKKYHTPDVFVFHKGRMNEALIENLNTSEVGEIYLAENRPRIEHFAEIPFGKIFFKTKSDLLERDIDFINKEIEKKIVENSGSSEIEQVMGCLKDLTVTELEKDSKNFKRIKTVTLFMDILSKWGDLSSSNVSFGQFDLKLMCYACSLKLPRIFNIPLVENNNIIVRGLGELNLFNRDCSTIICASSSYLPIMSSYEKYGDSVTEILRTIGPVARKKFGFEFVKENILSVLQSKETKLFIEEDLFFNDVGWNNIFSSLKNINNVECKENESKEITKTKIFDKQKHELKSLSASQMQTYVDCPRKYYYRYIFALDQLVDAKNFITPSQLGIIEHLIIETYIKSSCVFKMDGVVEIANTTFDNYLSINKIKLDTHVYEKSKLEVIYYSSNAIKALCKFREISNLKEIQTEYKFYNKSKLIARNGCVDAVIDFDESFGLIDLKRSSASIPSAADFFSFNNVQLWFYLENLGKDVKDVGFCGFLNISDVEKSTIYTKNNEVSNILNDLSFLEGKKISSLEIDFEKQLGKFRKFESDIVDKIQGDLVFSPNPRSKNACTFCVANNICDKGE